MRSLYAFCLGALFLGLLANVVYADTFQLTDGTSISGEIILPASADGLNIKVAEGKYQRVPWEKFSQSALIQLARNPKIAPYVEGLIEPPEDERAKKTQVDIKPVPRLERPSPNGNSLVGALFSSPLGVVALLLIYAAGIYAAYEISVFRAQPAGLVCGVSAVAPVIGQIVFLCMPTRVTSHQPAVEQVNPQAVPDAPQFHEATSPEDSGGLRIAQQTESPSAPTIPETQVFVRGQFTFNRRFFETRFPGFFGVVRRDADKDMVLIVKASRGEYEAHRITRIVANEVHLDVRKGNASEEISVPFLEIREVQLKHKNA